MCHVITLDANRGFDISVSAQDCDRFHMDGGVYVSNTIKTVMHSGKFHIAHTLYCIFALFKFPPLQSPTNNKMQPMTHHVFFKDFCYSTSTVGW